MDLRSITEEFLLIYNVKVMECNEMQWNATNESFSWEEEYRKIWGESAKHDQLLFGSQWLYD